MATMSPILLPLLVLVAGCFCSPTPWKIGGKIGYSNIINGSIGGVFSAVRDGLSFNTTGGAVLDTLWKPKGIAQVYYGSGKDMKVIDASVGGTVYNSFRPGFQSALGRNSNGTWISGLTGQPGFNGTYDLTPILQYEQGDEALKLLGMSPTGSENINEAAEQVPVNGAPGYYGMAKPYVPNSFGPYPYQSNPYAFNTYGAVTPYGYLNSFDPRTYNAPTPNMAYGNLASNAYGTPNSYYNNPYVAENVPPTYYVTRNPYTDYYGNPQGMVQWQVPQPQVPQPQVPQPQVPQPQVPQPQVPQPQVPQPQVPQPQVTQ